MTIIVLVIIAIFIAGLFVCDEESRREKHFDGWATIYGTKRKIYETDKRLRRRLNSIIDRTNERARKRWISRISGG